MLEALMQLSGPDLGAWPLASVLSTAKSYFLVLVGFSLVIFLHELGHFLAAKWWDVKVERFCIGFGREILGFTRGETRYSLNILPLGGYVKMHGQEDFAVDKSGEWKVKDDPRSFTNKRIPQRMIIVSAGVVMNVVCAALLFMLVFMIGTDYPSAVVGGVAPESPAEGAGLRAGDRIIRINGNPIMDFNDLSAGIKLSDPDKPMTIVFRRQDPDDSQGAVETHTVRAQAEVNADVGMLQLGVSPVRTNVVVFAQDDPIVPADQQVRPGDEILEIDGRAVSTYMDILAGLMRREGELGTLKVKRTLLDGTTEVREVKRRARRGFNSTGDPTQESGHLLGLVPRRQIDMVVPNRREDLAGLKNGDVIMTWNGHIAPTIKEIVESITANPERDMRVQVLRMAQGTSERASLLYRPKGSGLFRKDEQAKISMRLAGQEEERLIVSDIVTNLDPDTKTPAAALKDQMPRGSLIKKVNGQDVGTWGELTDRFIELAGKDVELTWTTPEREQRSGIIHIPDSLAARLKLPPDHRITRINGESQVQISEEGQLIPYSANNWRGAREILRRCVGQTVEVRHRGLVDSESQIKQVLVTEDMLDNWVMRLGYQNDGLYTALATVKVQELNPFKAMMIGIYKTTYFMKQVYVMMQRMVVKRSVGLDQVSGPVGIVKMGSDIAERDIVKLLYFLALISANLAVINFLPLPIVDGGLFIFLVAEKIKGRPISMKVQMATQLIGFALIVSIFLYVTFNDFLRLME